MKVQFIKKIKMLMIFSLISLSLNAQVFVSLEPVFLRPGLLYNYTTKTVGVYGKVWYGNIKGRDGSKFNTNNIKCGLGLSYKTKGLKPYLGINYNYFFNTVSDDKVIDLDRIKKVSFDVGVSFDKRRFSLLMMTDFLNFESMIGISYKLKDKSHERYHYKSCY